ncbi:hypothetical protein [Synechococcus sp. MIT S1220]|uniref:hypothetical protein n=1 Tax=Synechococcus sp. MIT S1220 TaxID=3082549 RepID=UPI0039AF2C00
MANWEQDLFALNFKKEKQIDGSLIYALNIGDQRQSYWTKITVKQVGRPQKDAWQVICARSEIQVGIWKVHEVTKDISVDVYTSVEKMLSAIKCQIKLKPSFLLRIT